jgi:hypothetical protein
MRRAMARPCGDLGPVPPSRRAPFVLRGGRVTAAEADVQCRPRTRARPPLEAGLAMRSERARACIHGSTTLAIGNTSDDVPQVGIKPCRCEGTPLFGGPPTSTRPRRLARAGRASLADVSRAVWVPFLALAMSAALIASCKDATQVDVVLRSNVVYAPGSEVGVWATHSGVFGAPLVQNADPWAADGELGNVVVTPRAGSAGGREAPLAVRVAMGLRGKRAAECTDDGDSKGCIIARRQLAFVPHTRLKVPVVLYLACEGVKCGPTSTCSYLGQCVPAQVDPASCATPEGCTLPGEPPFVPGQRGTVDASASDGSPTAKPPAHERFKTLLPWMRSAPKLVLRGLVPLSVERSVYANR